MANKKRLTPEEAAEFSAKIIVAEVYDEISDSSLVIEAVSEIHKYQAVHIQENILRCKQASDHRLEHILAVHHRTIEPFT